MNLRRFGKLEFCVLASATLLIASTSWSKTINTYGVSVQVQNTAFGGSQLPEVALAVMGVTCTSALTVNELETMQDKQGQMADYSFSQKSSFALTMLGQPQQVSQVTVNPDHANARVNVAIQEDCSGDLPVPSTCDDGKGGTVPCVKTETVSMPMHWECDIPASQLPATGNKNLECNPPNDEVLLGALTNNPLHTLALNYLHAKKITIGADFRGTRELLRNYNCPDNFDLQHMNPDLAKIIRFDGGIKTGSFAKNKIQYEYSINGGPQIEKDRADGVTNFDVLYCKKSAGEPIELSLGAQYGSHSVAAQQAVFNGGVNEQTIHFETPGSDFGKKESQVTIHLKSAGSTNWQ